MPEDRIFLWRHVTPEETAYRPFNVITDPAAADTIRGIEGTEVIEVDTSEIQPAQRSVSVSTLKTWIEEQRDALPQDENDPLSDGYRLALEDLEDYLSVVGEEVSLDVE